MELLNWFFEMTFRAGFCIHTSVYTVQAITGTKKKGNPQKTLDIPAIPCIITHNENPSPCHFHLHRAHPLPPDLQPSGLH